MSDIQDKIDQFEADADLAHQIVHGDASTTVTTEGGDVDSFAKAMAQLSLSGTSSTNLSIGTSTKVFTTQAGKGWILGQRLRAASADGTEVMDGEVTAYSGTSLTLAVDYVEGSGTYADWNISLIGSRGATGATGATGAMGATGATGATGAAGATWFNGATDPSAGTGANGDFYLQTGNGSTGVLGDVWTKAAGTWSIIGNIRGATGATGSTGAAGAAGAVWFNGSADPSGGTGANGDFYLQTGNGSSGTLGDVWTKAAGSWSITGNIRGPAGGGDVTGPAGAAVGRLPTFADATGKVLQDSGVLLSALALLASPAFTGNPTAPTQSAGNNSTRLATTAFVAAAIASLVASSPAALDTLNELAAALGNDPNFATTITTALAGKLPVADTSIGAHQLIFGSDFMTVPTSGGPSRGTVAFGSANLPSLDFDPATDEIAYLAIPLPKSWNTGTMTVTLVWAAAATGNVRWDVSGRAMGDDDARSSTLGTAQSFTDGVTATGDVMISAASAAMTLTSSPAKGDMMILGVNRDANNGADTCGADASLIYVIVTVTTDAGTDA